MTKAGYETYLLYLALQKHFSSKYDFFQYNGKVKASTEAYQRRSDIFSFEKLPKIIPKEDHIDFFVAHFLDNPKEWIKNMSKEKWEQRKAIYKNLPNKFREDLEYIKMIGPSDVLQTGSDIPKIHRLVMDGTISLETAILIDTIFPYLDKHIEQVNVPFVWPEYHMKFKKYQPFLKNKVGNTINTLTDIARDVLLKP